MRMHKTNLLLMTTSIGLHFCKLLSLCICLEFAPPQTNQEFYMKVLFLLSKILAADCRIYHKINFPLFYLSNRLECGELEPRVGIHREPPLNFTQLAGMDVPRGIC